jgi:hypothetical protein
MDESIKQILKLLMYFSIAVLINLFLRYISQKVRNYFERRKSGDIKKT